MWLDMFDQSDRSTVYCTASLRAQWPNPLAGLWWRAYPELFDDADLRQLGKQPDNHFREWLTAVHHHHRYGVSVLVEKYMCSADSHPRKYELLERVVGRDAAAFLRTFVRGGQPPDLLVYAPGYSQYWFVEVKGSKEGPTEAQPETFDRIREELGARIELVTVETLPTGARAG